MFEDVHLGDKTIKKSENLITVKVRTVVPLDGGGGGGGGLCLEGGSWRASGVLSKV